MGKEDFLEKYCSTQKPRTTTLWGSLNGHGHIGLVGGSRGTVEFSSVGILVKALARSLAGPKTRSIYPARMPMMTRVIKISTRVKPFFSWQTHKNPNSLLS
jgi:hypothetical protein